MTIRKLVIFDLDDTLYDERSFVESGFLAVSRFLEKQYGINAEQCQAIQLSLLDANGRGQVFNDLVRLLGLPQSLVFRLVSIYRSHPPKLSLLEGASDSLELSGELANMKPHLVTDGNRLVQRKKVAALGLGDVLGRAWYTRDFSVNSEKPCAEVFRKLLASEKLEASNAIYVGDDPNKDFVPMNLLGGTSIRLRRGRFQDHEPVNSNYAADYSVSDHKELQELLAKLLANVGQYARSRKDLI